MQAKSQQNSGLERSATYLLHFIFTGNCNAELFELYIKNILIKALKFGDVLVMDNINFHKTQKVKEFVESVGASTLFLPTYSPDLKSIIVSIV